MSLPPDRPRLRALWKPAFLTAGACLLAFGLAHAAFITWVPSPSQDGEAPPPVALRLLVMLVAPMAIGIPFAAISALLHAIAWRAVHGTPLASWRYGLALASGFVPPVALSIVHGPYGDATPSGLSFGMLAVAMVALPALVGFTIARKPAGTMLGLFGLALTIPWTGFLMGTGVTGWVVPFVVSLFLILLGAGGLMERFSRRAPPEAFSPGAVSSEA